MGYAKYIYSARGQGLVPSKKCDTEFTFFAKNIQKDKV